MLPEIRSQTKDRTLDLWDDFGGLGHAGTDSMGSDTYERT